MNHDTLLIFAAVGLLISGFLELMFAALSCMGIGLGSMMVFGDVAMPNDGDIGILIVGIYGMTLVGSSVAAAGHLAGGVHLLMGGRRPVVLWAAVAVALADVFTIYCIPTGLLASGFLAVVLLLPMVERASASSAQAWPPAAPDGPPVNGDAVDSDPFEAPSE